MLDVTQLICSSGSSGATDERERFCKQKKCEREDGDGPRAEDVCARKKIEQNNETAHVIILHDFIILFRASQNLRQTIVFFSFYHRC